MTGLLSGAAARGIDVAALLRAAQVPVAVRRDRTVRVPIARYAALYNLTVQALGDEAFGLFAQPVRPGAFEFLCRGVVGSRTLGEALERAARFLALVLPELAVGTSRRRGRAVVRIAEPGRPRLRRDDARRVFAFEWLLRLVHGLACWLVARPIPLESVRFPYRRPPHAADYALIYTEHSTFEAAALEATFDASLLDLPVRRDQSDLAAFLEGAPGEIALLYRRDREVANAVRGHVARTLAAGSTLEDAARALGMTARTLHRRLREEGTS
ncbi:MAG TPA: AraC family transcriptional regulator, partial [Myxococcota bacterium]|nr:AraC family transcriptional regulator [Myxococcota bacterium]